MNYEKETEGRTKSRRITLFFLSVLDIICKFGVAERFCGALALDVSCRLLCDAFNCLDDDDEWWCKIGPAESGR